MLVSVRIYELFSLGLNRPFLTGWGVLLFSIPFALALAGLAYFLSDDGRTHRE